MFKYSVKAFDGKGDLAFSAVVHPDHLFDFLDRYSSDYVVKAYIIDDETNGSDV